MKSERLNFIASLIPNNSKVVDIGTDHAYLPIILYQKGITKIIGTDISDKVIFEALKKLYKYDLIDKIAVIHSDGLTNVDTKDYDTLVIAGMGYMTIRKILNNKEKLKSIKTIILQTNNDYDKMRLFMNKLNYTLKKEHIIEERNIIYHIMEYVIGKEPLSEEEIMCGKYNKNNIFFYQREQEKLKTLLASIPKNYPQKRKKIEKKIKHLEKYISTSC